MPARYYIGRRAYDKLNELRSRRAIVIQTERFRNIMGINLPSRGMLSEPDFIVDAYYDDNGKLVLIILDRWDDKAFLEIPTHSQIEIARELSKPEWGTTATLVRGFLKTLPWFVVETGLRALGGALAGGVGGVAGAASGVVSGIEKVENIWRIGRAAVRARRLLRMLPALRRAPIILRSAVRAGELGADALGILRSLGVGIKAAGATAIRSPALRYIAEDVVPNIVGWVGQEYAQLRAQPSFAVKHGYLPAFAVGAGQGVFDMILRRYFPASRLAKTFERPVVGTFLHGTGSMFAYSALKQLEKRGEIDIKEAFGEALPTGLMGAALPASIWAAGKLLRAGPLGRWVRRRSFEQQLYEELLRRQPKGLPPAPEELLPRPKALPGPTEKVRALPGREPIAPPPPPEDVDLSTGVQIYPPSRTPQPEILTIEDVPSIAPTVKEEVRKRIEEALANGEAAEVAWLMGILGVKNIDELKEIGPSRAVGLLAEDIKRGTKLRKNDIAKWFNGLVENARKQMGNIPVEDENAAYAYIDSIVGVMTARNEFTLGPRHSYTPSIRAAHVDIESGYRREAGLLTEFPHNLKPRGYLERRARYLARRVIDAVKENTDWKTKRTLLIAFGARSLEEAEEKIANFAMHRYRMLADKHGFADDRTILYEISRFIKDVRESLSESASMQPKVNTWKAELKLVVDSVLGMGDEAVRALARGVWVGDNLEELVKILQIEYMRMKREFGPNALQKFAEWVNQMMSEGAEKLGIQLKAKYAWKKVAKAIAEIMSLVEKQLSEEGLSKEENKRLEKLLDGHGLVMLWDDKGDISLEPKEPVGGHKVWGEIGSRVERIREEIEATAAPKTPIERVEEYIRQEVPKEGIQEVSEPTPPPAPPEEPTTAPFVPVAEQTSPPERLKGVEDVDDRTPHPSEEQLPPAPKTELEKRAEEQIQPPTTLESKLEERTKTPTSTSKPKEQMFTGYIFAGEDMIGIAPSFTIHNVMDFVNRALTFVKQEMSKFAQYFQQKDDPEKPKLTREMKRKLLQVIARDLALSMQFLYHMVRWGRIEDVPIVVFTSRRSNVIGEYVEVDNTKYIQIYIPNYLEAYSEFLTKGSDDLRNEILAGTYPTLLHEIVHNLVKTMYDTNKEFKDALNDWYNNVSKWAEENWKNDPFAEFFYQMIYTYRDHLGQKPEDVMQEMFTRIATLEIAAIYPSGMEPDQIYPLEIIRLSTASAILTGLQKLGKGGYFEKVEKIFNKFFKNLFTPPTSAIPDDITAELKRPEVRARLNKFYKEFFWITGWEEPRKSMAAVPIEFEGFKIDAPVEIVGAENADLILDYLEGSRSVKSDPRTYNKLVQTLQRTRQKLINQLHDLVAKSRKFVPQQLPLESIISPEGIPSRVVVSKNAPDRETNGAITKALEITEKIHFINRALDALEEKRLAETEEAKRHKGVRAGIEGLYDTPSSVLLTGRRDVFTPITFKSTRDVPNRPDLKEVYIEYLPSHRRFIAAIDLLEENKVAPITKRQIVGTEIETPMRLAFTEAVPYRRLTDEELKNFYRHSHQFPSEMVFMPHGIDPVLLTPENREKAAQYLTSSLRVFVMDLPEEEASVLRNIAIARLYEFAKALFALSPTVPAKDEKAPNYAAVLRKDILYSRRWRIDYYDASAKVDSFVAFLLRNVDLLVNPQMHFGKDVDIFDAIHLMLTFYQNYLVRPSDLGAPIWFVHALEEDIDAWRTAIATRNTKPDFKQEYDIPASDTALRQKLEQWYNDEVVPFLDSKQNKAEYRVYLSDGRKAFQYIASQVPLDTLKKIHQSLRDLFALYTQWKGAKWEEKGITATRLDEMQKNILKIEELIKQKAPREDIEALTLDTVLAAFQFLLENPVFIKAEWGDWGANAGWLLGSAVKQLNPLMQAFLLGYHYPRMATRAIDHVPHPFDLRSLMHARYMERVKHLALDGLEELSETLSDIVPSYFWTKGDIATIARGIADENMQVLTLDILASEAPKEEAIIRAGLPEAAKGYKRNPGMYYYYLRGYPEIFGEALRNWLEEQPDRRFKQSQPDFLLAALFSGHKLPPEKTSEMVLNANEAWGKFRALFSKVFGRIIQKHGKDLVEIELGYKAPNRYSSKSSDVALSLAYHWRRFFERILGVSPEEMESYSITPSEFVAFLEYLHYTRGSYSARVTWKGKFPNVMSLRGNTSLTIREFFELFEKILTPKEMEELREIYKHPGFSPFAYTLDLMFTHARRKVEDPVLANALRRIDDDVAPPRSYEELIEQGYRRVESPEAAAEREAMATVEAAFVSPEAVIPLSAEDVLMETAEHWGAGETEAPTEIPTRIDEIEAARIERISEGLEHISNAMAEVFSDTGLNPDQAQRLLQLYEALMSKFPTVDQIAHLLYVAMDDEKYRELPVDFDFDIYRTPLQVTRFIEKLRELGMKATRAKELLKSNNTDEAYELMSELIQIADAPGGLMRHVLFDGESNRKLNEQVRMLKETQDIIMESPIKETMPEQDQILANSMEAWRDWYAGWMVIAGMGQGSRGLQKTMRELFNVMRSIYADVEDFKRLLRKRYQAEEIFEMERMVASADYTSPTTAMELEKGQPIINDTGDLVIDTTTAVHDAFTEHVISRMWESDLVVRNDQTKEINWAATRDNISKILNGFRELLANIVQANEQAASQGKPPINVMALPEFMGQAAPALQAMRWLIETSEAIVNFYGTSWVSEILQKNSDVGKKLWTEYVEPIYKLFKVLRNEHIPLIEKALEGVVPVEQRESMALYEEMRGLVTKADTVAKEYPYYRNKYNPKPEPQQIATGIPPTQKSVHYAIPLTPEDIFKTARDQISSNSNMVWVILNKIIGSIYNSFKILSPVVGHYIEHIAHHLNDVTYKYKAKFFNLLDRSIRITEELQKRYPQNTRFVPIDIAITLVGLNPQSHNFSQREQEFHQQVQGFLKFFQTYDAKRNDPNIGQEVRVGESMRAFWDEKMYEGLVAIPYTLVTARIDALKKDPEYARELLNVAGAYRLAGNTMHAEAREHRVGIRTQKRGAIAESIGYIEDYYPFIPSEIGGMLLHMLRDITEKLTEADWKNLWQGEPPLPSAEFFKRLTNLREKPSSFQHQIEFRRNLPWGWLLLMSDLNPVHTWLQYAQGLASLVGEYEALDTFAGILKQNPDHYKFFKTTLKFLDEWAQQNPDVAPPPDKMWDMIIQDAVNNGIDHGTIGAGGYLDPVRAKQQMVFFVNMLHGTYNPVNLHDYQRLMVLKDLFEGVKATTAELRKHGITEKALSFLLPKLTTKTGRAQYGRLLHTIEKGSPGLWNAMSILTSYAVTLAFSFRTALMNLPEGIALSMGMALAKDGTFVRQLWDNLKMALSMLKGMGVAVRKVFTSREFWNFYTNLLKGKADPKVIDQFLDDETMRAILSRFINTMYAGAVGRELKHEVPEWWLHWASFFNLMEMFTLTKSAAALKAYLEDKAPIFKRVLAGTASFEDEDYVNRLLMHWNFGDVNRLKFIAEQEARLNRIDPKDVDQIWEKVRPHITYRGVFELHHEYGAWDMPELWHSNPFVNRAFYWIRSFSIQQGNKFLHHFITSKHKSAPAKMASALAMMVAYGLVIYPIMKMAYSAVSGNYDEAPADLFSPVTWKCAIFNTVSDMFGAPTSPLGIYGDATAILEYAMRSRSPMGAVRSVVSPLANTIVDTIWTAFQTAKGYVTGDPYAFEKAKETGEQLIPMRAVFGKLIPHATEKMGWEFPAAATTSRKLSAQLLRVYPMTKNWVTDQPHHNWLTKILPLLASGDAQSLAHLILQTRPGVIYDVLTRGEKLTPTQYAKLLDAIEPVLRRFDPQEYERFIQIKPYLIQWANEQAAVQKQSAVVNLAPITAQLEKYLFELLSELPDDLRNTVVNHLIIGAVERGMQPSSLKAPSMPDIPIEVVVNAAAVGDVPKLRVLGAAAAFMGRGLLKEAIKSSTGINDEATEIFLHKFYSAVEERKDAWAVVDKATAHSAYRKAFKYTADALATVFDYVFPHMTHPQLKEFVGKARQAIGTKFNQTFKTYTEVFPPAIALRKAWEDTMQDPDIIDQITALGDIIRTAQQPRILFFRRVLQGEKIQREPIVGYDYLIDANWFNTVGRGERMGQRMARAENVTFEEAQPEPYMLPSFLR